MKKYLSFIFLIYSLNNYSCSCIGIKSFYWHYNNTNLLFKGKIIQLIDTSKYRFGELSIIYQIQTVYKGRFLYDTIILKTAKDGAACGLEVDTGQVWIIFSNTRRIGVCSPNILLSGKGISEPNHQFGIYKPSWIISKLDGLKKEENQYIKEYNSKNKLITEGQLNNGLANGNWKYHLEYFIDTEWPSDTKVFYKNGLKDSCEYEYLSNKKLYSITNWKNGKKHGVEKKYHKNGKVEYVRNYFEGKEDGEGRRFYANGKLRAISYHDNGKPIKIYLEFHPNGDTNVAYFYNDLGKQTKTFATRESGVLIWYDTYTYRNDTCFQYETGYHLDGKLWYKGLKVNSKYHGEHLRYHENGNIEKKEYYNYGTPIGKWLYYDTSGALIKEEKKE